MDIDVLINVFVVSFVLILGVCVYFQYIVSKKNQSYISLKVFFLMIFNIAMPILSTVVLSNFIPFPSFEEDMVGTFIGGMFLGALVYCIFPIVSLIVILITHLCSTFFWKRRTNKSYLSDNKSIDFEK